MICHGNKYSCDYIDNKTKECNFKKDCKYQKEDYENNHNNNQNSSGRRNKNNL